MALARLYDFTPSTVIQSSQVDGEFDQLVNALNGGSTDKDITMRLNHATNPALTLDQQHASGIIQMWKAANTEKARVTINGQYRGAVNAAGSEFIILGGQYKQNVTEVANVGAGEDDLHSHTIAANTFGSVGDTLEIIATGRIVATGNNKTLNFYVDGQLIFTYSVDPASSTGWLMKVTTIRTTASALYHLITFMDELETTAYGSAIESTGHTFTNSMIIKWTGQDTDGTSSRISQLISVIRKFFAAS